MELGGDGGGGHVGGATNMVPNDLEKELVFYSKQSVKKVTKSSRR